MKNQDVKKTGICIAFVLAANIAFCQSNKKELKEQPVQPKLEISTTISEGSKSVTPTELKVTEALLTPEEQGFTKTNVNGKEVYVKQSGSMIIYYEPKK